MSFEKFQAALLLYAKANNITVFAYKNTNTGKSMCVNLMLVDIYHDAAVKEIAKVYGTLTQAIDGMICRLYFFDLKR